MIICISKDAPLGIVLICAACISDLIVPSTCKGHNISLVSIYDVEFSIPKEMSLHGTLEVGSPSRLEHKSTGCF